MTPGLTLDIGLGMCHAVSVAKVTLEEGLEAAEEARREIEQALIDAGLTPEYLASRLIEELDATERKVFLSRWSQRLIYSKPLPAWTVRQHARQDAHRLLDHYPSERHEITGRGGGPIDVRYVNNWRQNGNGHQVAIPTSGPDPGEE